MQQNTYLLIASCILGLVAAMHLVRVIRGQPLTIGSWKMPFWASLLWILVVTFPAQAQAPNESTVIYLVRHAEKVDDSRDPPLSELGLERALLLAQMLRDADLTHLHSTDLERTRDTANPIALQTGLKVQIYNPQHLTEFAGLLRSIPGRHLVVGHSNTTPQLVRLLGGKSSEIADDEYDRLYVLTIQPMGGATTVLVRFGTPRAE